jgi:hypothetical protein
MNGVPLPYLPRWVASFFLWLGIGGGAASASPAVRLSSAICPSGSVYGLRNAPSAATVLTSELSRGARDARAPPTVG